MKPTRSAKRTETRRRSAAGAVVGARPAASPRRGERRSALAAELLAGLVRRAARRAAARERRPALGAELPPLAVLRAAARAGHAGTSARVGARRRAARATASPRAARRSRAPRRATTRRRSARRARAASPRARTGCSSSRKRAAAASKPDGSPLEARPEPLRLRVEERRPRAGGNALDESEELLDLRRLAERQRRLDRLDDALLCRLRGDADVRLAASMVASASASASRESSFGTTQRGPRRRGSSTAPGASVESSSRENMREDARALVELAALEVDLDGRLQQAQHQSAESSCSCVNSSLVACASSQRPSMQSG